MCGVPPPPHPNCSPNQESRCSVPPNVVLCLCHPRLGLGFYIRTYEHTFMCVVPPPFNVVLCLGLSTLIPQLKYQSNSTYILECGTPSSACFIFYDSNWLEQQEARYGGFVVFTLMMLKKILLLMMMRSFSWSVQKLLIGRISALCCTHIKPRAVG